MFGEDDSWHIVADWLKGLDSEDVLQYFEGRRYTTRLGDHFAACIEYVLKFSPLLAPNPLFISQQVGGCTIRNEHSLKALKRAKGEFGSFGLQKGGVMSEVIVKLIENDILIKRFSSYRINRRGRLKEVPESDIECLMAGFNNSSFDYHAAEEIKDFVLPEECHEESFSELNHTDAVYEGTFVLPELLGIDMFTRATQKWRVFYSSEHNEGFTGKEAQTHRLPVNTANGPQSESKEEPSQDTNRSNFAPSDRALPNATSVGKYTTVRDGKMHMSRTYTNAAWRNPTRKSTSSKNLKAVKRVGALKHQIETADRRVTAGECDFLFKVNANQLVLDSLDYAWTHVHHWEVSVHFLLYIGPWEVFGLVTPGSSSWHHSGKRVFAANEGLDPNSIRLYLGTLQQLLNTPVGPDQVLVPDACYVAPSVGDSWLDRKKEMSSKLRLCRHPNMAAKVSNLFHSSLPPTKGCHGSLQQRQVQETESRDFKPLFGPEGQSYDKYREDSSIIRVIPRALNKGYLFYEPDLWYSLCTRRDQGEYHRNPTQTKRDGSSESSRNFSTSRLNVNHWMGWWVHACDFAEFAYSYGCDGSRWYIAPRNEWLSPVVIGSSETHRCRRVFDLVGLLTMILKVGEEAATLKPQRQRRFMVVEVCWSPDISTTVVSPTSCKYKTGTHHHHQGVESSEQKGSWVEVSRGFIVEKTWPESRQQLAHGFSLSWSPVLLGWS